MQTVTDLTDANSRFYESFRIGDTAASADEGAALILAGTKTATSELLWAYEAGSSAPPQMGALSIVENGRGEPVCIIETTEVFVRAFNQIDAQFAAEYGEWDRTLAGWRTHCWAYYAARCRRLGREPSPDMPLVCERFRVVYPRGDGPT